MTDIALDIDRPSMPWAQTNGMWISGRAWLDEVDQLAADMEAKWGAGRLRLLVTPELREKFDRQRYLLNQANWHGDLEAVRQQSTRMLTAWRALDAAAWADGKSVLDPEHVWEIATTDGTVIAIVPDASHYVRVQAEGRHVRVITLDEIGRLLSEPPAWVLAIKEHWPGATVEAVRRTVADPLAAIHDTKEPLDLPEDEIPF